MNIHEYQAKEIFNRYNLPVPKGMVAFSVDEAVENAKRLGGDIWAVKAQIHAGGRGLGGGVKIAKSLEEVKKCSSEILGMTLVTHQTGPQGKLVQKIYIEEGVQIEDEFYLSIVLDRAKEIPVIIASAQGGMEIEKLALKYPKSIIKVAIDPSIGFNSYHARKLYFGLGINDKEQRKKFSLFASSLYELYLKKDAELIEINPLIRTKSGDFVALDAKMSFDDNALFRHEDIESYRDLSEEDEIELEAKRYGLSYIRFDGYVGCVVNGAGLAMGTMDAIEHANGKSANFLDVGGKADEITVAKGFEIILKDKNVKSIFINIFGGIVRCDRVAYGILEATKKVDTKIPLIVRLDGTNANEAMDMLKEAKIKNIITATDLEDGAKKAVKAAKEMR